MQPTLRTTCVCGWETTGPEDDVVAATLDHGQKVHNMGGTREDVLERAERIDPLRRSRLLGRTPIVDVPERRRFEARLGARLAGFSQYRQGDGTIELLHTEVDPDFEGKGFGSKLAAAVLADVTGRELRVVVLCPFISAYVRRHRADYPGIELERERNPSP